MSEAVINLADVPLSLLSTSIGTDAGVVGRGVGSERVEIDVGASCMADEAKPIDVALIGKFGRVVVGTGCLEPAL